MEHEADPHIGLGIRVCAAVPFTPTNTSMAITATTLPLLILLTKFVSLKEKPMFHDWQRKDMLYISHKQLAEAGWMRSENERPELTGNCHGWDSFYWLSSYLPQVLPGFPTQWDKWRWWYGVFKQLILLIWATLKTKMVSITTAWFQFSRKLVRGISSFLVFIESLSTAGQWFQERFQMGPVGPVCCVSNSCPCDQYRTSLWCA